MALRGERGDEQGLRRKALVLAFVSVLVALILNSFFGDRGMLHLLGQQERAAALQKEVEQLKVENARLASEITALRSDPAAVERIAREQLGFVGPGETEFLLPQD